MEEMTRRIILAAFLGILVGVAVGYSPMAQPTSAPRAQNMMQAEQPTVAPPTHPAYGLPPLLTSVLAGLVIALPVFLMARRRVS